MEESEKGDVHNDSWSKVEGAVAFKECVTWIALASFYHGGGEQTRQAKEREKRGTTDERQAVRAPLPSIR